MKADVAGQQTTPVADVVHGFNRYLHGARGLFALMIVLFHVVNSHLPTFALLASGPLLFFLRTFEYGVELFFAVSGIVIVGALSRAHGPLIFAIERGTRIYPVLWASVLVVVIASGATQFQGRTLPSGAVLIENLLALPPLLPGPVIHPPAWSLSYELCFYGFCALGWSLRRWIGSWALVLIVPAAIYLLGAHLRAILMPVGMGVALLLARRPALARLAFAPGLGLLAFLGVWGVVCGRYGDDIIERNALDLAHGTTPLLVLVAVAAAVFTFAGILGGRGALSLLLASAPCQFLGSISYSLYLWHPVILAIVKHAMYLAHLPQRVGPASQLLFLAVCLPPSLLAGWGSQRLLEKRVTVWLRRRLESVIPRRPVGLTPTTVAHP